MSEIYIHKSGEPHHYVKHDLGELGKSALELSELRLFSKK